LKFWKTVSSTLLTPLQSFYTEHERILAPIFFLAGVGYDSFTLTRIDRLSDNLLLFTYLVILGGLILIVGRMKFHDHSDNWLVRFENHYPYLLQFLLGGLFSAYAIYYFRSISFSSTAFFFVLLVGLLVVNESLSDRLMNFPFLVVLYFFVCSSYFIYLLPILFERMGPDLFYGSLGLSLAVVSLILAGTFYGDFRREKKSIAVVGSVVLLVLGVFAVSYQRNWIPPVPLSMEFGGVYHHVERADGQYRLTYADRSWSVFTQNYEDPFLWREGDRVHCFVSVFAPTQLRTRVVQEWQIWREEEGWITTDTVDYPIYGGREGGYRGHSYKQNVRPGEWRVNVKTAAGRLLGRIPFEIVKAGKEEIPMTTIEM